MILIAVAADRLRLQPAALRHDRPAGSHGLNGDARGRAALRALLRPAARGRAGRHGEPVAGPRSRDRPDARAAAGRRASPSGAPGRDHGRAAALRLPRHPEGADRAGRRASRERDFLDAVGRFAAGQRAFAVPRSSSPNCRAFSPWCRRRAAPSCRTWPTAASWSSTSSAGPPSEAELARRRAAGLTPRQDELLMRWGYPYVLERMALPSHADRRACPTRPNGRRSPSCCASALRGFIDRPLPVQRSLRLPPARAGPAVHRAGALQARRRTAGECRSVASSLTKACGRVIERAVIHDRHQRAVRRGRRRRRARSRSAAAPASSRPRVGRRSFSRSAGAVISTGYGVLDRCRPSFRKCSREPLTTTVRPASRQAWISRPMP